MIELMWEKDEIRINKMKIIIGIGEIELIVKKKIERLLKSIEWILKKLKGLNEDSIGWNKYNLKRKLLGKLLIKLEGKIRE